MTPLFVAKNVSVRSPGPAQKILDGNLQSSTLHGYTGNNNYNNDLRKGNNLDPEKTYLETGLEFLKCLLRVFVQC